MAKQQRQWSALILCSLSHSNAQPARQQSLGRDRIDVPSRAVGPRDVSHPCAAQPITIAIDFGLASLARSHDEQCVLLFPPRSGKTRSDLDGTTAPRMVKMYGSS